MSEDNGINIDFALPFVLVLFGTAMSALVMFAIPDFDAEIFRRLSVAFGEPTGPALALRTAPLVELVVNSLGMTLVNTAAMMLSFHLPTRPRIFASVSLFALVLLYLWIGSNAIRATMHPLGFFAALPMGILSGLYLRSRQLKSHDQQAHSYELKLKDKELQDARLTILKHDEIERRTLAGDLHDQVLNDLKQVAQLFDKYTKEHTQENEQPVRALLDQVMGEIREVMDALSPSVLEHLGLGPAIEDCLRRGSKRAGFKMRFKNSVDTSALDKLTPVEQGLLYRLAQESITNICKHAQASLVKATMTSESNFISIRITDDGKGMDFAKAQAESRGMKYMRYRAELIGASVNWKPGDDGKGVAVEIRMALGEA